MSVTVVRRRRPSAVLSPAPLLALFPGCSDRQVSEATGVSHRTVFRWRHGDLLKPDTADRVALAIGRHPADPSLWGRTWEADL